MCVWAGCFLGVVGASVRRGGLRRRAPLGGLLGGRLRKGTSPKDGLLVALDEAAAMVADGVSGGCRWRQDGGSRGLVARAVGTQLIGRCKRFCLTSLGQRG